MKKPELIQIVCAVFTITRLKKHRFHGSYCDLYTEQKYRRKQIHGSSVQHGNKTLQMKTMNIQHFTHMGYLHSSEHCSQPRAVWL
jgi:hypothetical protein